MPLGPLLVVAAILILVGVVPRWPHSRAWGYGPTGLMTIILIVLVVLVLLGRI